MSEQYLKNAITSFQKIYDERPTCEWARDSKLIATNLLERVIKGNAREMLDSWIENCVVENKLKKLI